MSATRVVPIYTCEDIGETVAWYRDILGTEIARRGSAFAPSWRQMTTSTSWPPASRAGEGSY